MIRRPNEDIPVFVIEGEKSGKKRTLHRNLLLPLGSKLQDEAAKETVQDPVRRRKSRRHHRRSGKDSDSCTASETSGSSDEDVVVIETTHVHGEQENDIQGTSSAGGDAHDLRESHREPDRNQPATTDESHRDISSPPQSVEPQQESAAADNGEETEVGERGTQDEGDSEETLPKQLLSTSPEVPPRPVPQPRNTAGPRTRSQPAWMRSGEYLLSHQTKSPGQRSEEEEQCKGAEKHPEDALDDCLEALTTMPESVIRLFVRQLLSKSGTKM